MMYLFQRLSRALCNIQPEVAAVRAANGESRSRSLKNLTQGGLVQDLVAWLAKWKPRSQQQASSFLKALTV